MATDPDDSWERVGETLDWVAGVFAARLGRQPRDLVWPAIAVGLVTGLGAEALKDATGDVAALTYVGVTLTTCGFGMLGLLAHRFRRGSGQAGARTADAEVLAPWLRRLQVLLVSVLVAVLALAVVGAVTGSVLLVARNSLEVGRVGAVVLTISWLLMDDEVGLPEWLAARLPVARGDTGA